MADYVVNKLEISGMSGNEMAQPRVFAHSVKSITIPSGNNSVDIFPSDTIPDPLPAGDTVVTNTIHRGACLYVGTGGNLYITLEDGSEALFKGVTSGSFLPVLAIKIWGDGKGTTAGDILALF